MKAMIFAAGLGTRLKPLTETMPKALVPVGGKPLLEHVICKLKQAGFDEVIINVHHFANQIISFLKEKNDFGIRVVISDEREQLLDTGGGIRKAAHFFDDGKPFLVHNVDILSDLDLKTFYRESVAHPQAASLLVSKRKTSRYLLFDEQLALKGWINTQTGETKSPLAGFDAADYTPYAFSGIHILSPALLKAMENFPSEKFSIIDFYLSICDRCALNAYPADALKMVDVGKLDTLNDIDPDLLIG